MFGMSQLGATEKLLGPNSEPGRLFKQVTGQDDPAGHRRRLLPAHPHVQPAPGGGSEPQPRRRWTPVVMRYRRAARRTSPWGTGRWPTARTARPGPPTTRRSTTPARSTTWARRRRRPTARRARSSRSTVASATATATGPSRSRRLPEGLRVITQVVSPFARFRDGWKGAPSPVRAGVAVVAVLVIWAVANATTPRGMPLGIVLIGVVVGSLYGLVATGIVLVYRANRVVNFAQAEFGSVAAVRGHRAGDPGEGQLLRVGHRRARRSPSSSARSSTSSSSGGSARRLA